MGFLEEDRVLTMVNIGVIGNFISYWLIEEYFIAIIIKNAPY
jgi:hypothetical protein